MSINTPAPASPPRTDPSPPETGPGAVGNHVRRLRATGGTYRGIAAVRRRPQTPHAPPGLGQLSPRERELVTLVAQGRTDAEIAGQLYISVRTVRSHLDRIRDKTGCRRRADLTRLALQASLV